MHVNSTEFSTYTWTLKQASAERLGAATAIKKEPHNPGKPEEF